MADSEHEERLKAYVKSCFIIMALTPPKDKDGKIQVDVAADVCAHWASLGLGTAIFSDWENVRYGARPLPAHDLSHVGGIEAFLEV